MVGPTRLLPAAEATLEAEGLAGLKRMNLLTSLAAIADQLEGGVVFPLLQLRAELEASQREW